MRISLKFSPMPIYEFYCSACRKDSEMLVRTTDWKGIQCPHCGSAKLAKKLSVFSASVASTGGEGCPDAAYCPNSSSAGGCCGGGAHTH